MTYCNVTGDRRRWEIMLMPGDDPAESCFPGAGFADHRDGLPANTDSSTPVTAGGCPS